MFWFVVITLRRDDLPGNHLQYSQILVAIKHLRRPHEREDYKPYSANKQSGVPMEATCTWPV